MKIKIDTTKFLAGLDKLSEKLGQAIVDGSHEAGLMIEGRIKEEWPVSTGESARQITTKTIVQKGKVVTRVGSSVKVPWAVIIEEGRKKGSKLPNLGAISKFLGRNKPLQRSLDSVRKEQYDKAKSHRSSFKPTKIIRVSDEFDDLDSKQKGMVFIIARAVARNGIKGKFIFKKVRGRSEKDARDIIFRKVLNILK